MVYDNFFKVTSKTFHRITSCFLQHQHIRTHFHLQNEKKTRHLIDFNGQRQVNVQDTFNLPQQSCVKCTEKHRQNSKSWEKRLTQKKNYHHTLVCHISCLPRNQMRSVEFEDNLKMNFKYSFLCGAVQSKLGQHAYSDCNTCVLRQFNLFTLRNAEILLFIPVFHEQLLELMKQNTIIGDLIHLISQFTNIYS